MIGKNSIERICRSAGMKPVTRSTIRGHEIFIADGFSLMPHNAFRRFGVGPDDFPAGMYCTLWWASKGDEKLDTGQPLFFDVYHDPEYTGAQARQQLRVNSALKAAREFIDQRRKAQAH